jgi:hypothetical protein
MCTFWQDSPHVPNHNSNVADEDFDKYNHDENYVPEAEASSSKGNRGNTHDGEEDQNMNRFCNWISDGLFRS